MLILVTALAFFCVNPALAGDTPAKPSDFDALSRSGHDHFYNLEYDEAIDAFQKAAEVRPDDPTAANHLLEAVLFKVLYEYDALDTSLYTQERFLSGRKVPVDNDVRQRIKDLSAKALELSEKKLRSAPKDTKALYARGVTRGLISTYDGLVEHAWFSALRAALAARGDHEQVLKLQPDFSDAKTIVGAHNYVIGSLPLPIKIMAGATGIRGDKKKGLDYLFQAGSEGSESGVDAKVTLALLLRREQRFDDAVKVVDTLVQAHPRNFLFALEEANLMKDAGKGPAAVAAFRRLLDGCKEGRYPNAHVELGEYAFAEALRGQSQYAESLQAYELAGRGSSRNQELRQRALVGAGEVSDLLTRRDEALKEYRAAIALDGSTGEAETARRYLSRPYQGR
ncbi:MAG TPA: tetratricopeptide repeat protein [Candidatus Angelobacter sp.]|nr:tetratricopeptide repeat protein [Candidatus Angelobacter sp.]